MADAGIKTSIDYPQDHVHQKLQKDDLLINNSGARDHSDNSRIDLIIGTHYDKDHLHGLVPIIEDNSIQIGEVWLPPVANDTEPAAREATPDLTQTLALQFCQEDGCQTLDNYLRRKAGVCDYIREFEQDAINRIKDDDPRIVDKSMLQDHGERLKQLEERQGECRIGDSAPDEEYFERHLAASALYGVSERLHDDIKVDEPDPEVALRLIKRYGSGSLTKFVLDHRGAKPSLRFGTWSGNFQAEVLSLAYIRRAAATDAINANSLSSVVEAVKKRNNRVPGQRRIEIRTQAIENGRPRRFSWNIEKGRFVFCGRPESEEPTLTLLGPSKGLIQKHWKRLPIGMYAMAAKVSPIPIKSISPSNQLSYVTKFEFSGQSILVCGDAGCVDFRRSRRGQYYRDLLDCLRDLHIIQVAHHAGKNAHFYRVLQSSDYAKESGESYLLLSHATHDKHRPSGEFEEFIQSIQTRDGGVQLLFTSKPTRDRVVDYLELIAPVVDPSGGMGAYGASRKVGDVRLSFVDDKWCIVKHAIEV